jgi:branched-chain amino acid transport system substrate-binding protein
MGAAGLGATGLGAADLATTACSAGLKQTTSGSSQNIKIGYISPKTGALAAFTESDDYVIGRVRAAIGKGLRIGGKTYPVEILTKDSQSSSARCSRCRYRCRYRCWCCGCPAATSRSAPGWWPRSS